MGLGGLVLLLLGAFLLVGAPFALARMRGPFVLRAVRVGGIAYAALMILVTLSTVVPLIGGGPASVSVPLAVHRLVRPSNVEFGPGPVAHIVDGGIDRATLTITGITVGTRILLIAAALALAGVAVTIALALARIAGATLRGEPFVPAVARSITMAAVVVAIGGTVSSVLQQIGEWRAGQDALYVTGWTGIGITDPSTTLAQLGWPDPAYFALDIPFLPIMLGLGLAAIAAVFRAGEHLQRDTAGLV
jgi:hypothetical protein